MIGPGAQTVDTEIVDTVVIGAGVVGLAVARQLARAGCDVIVLEAETQFGTQTSSRNSEVLHAGLYYPSTWLKTRLCVRGRALVQAFADERGVAWRKLGKLVVASGPKEEAALEALHRRANDNGVEALSMIDGAAARQFEPALAGTITAALHSPASGIIDSHALMLALLGDAQDHGAQLAVLGRVTTMEPTQGAIDVWVDGETPMRLRATRVVNAAGLDAVALANTMEAMPANVVPQAHRCQGRYFSLTGRAPFSRLIYPTVLPGAAGLGVHLTLDLGGQARFGPDTRWLADGEPDDAAVDPTLAPAFEASVRRYWPGLPEGALQPGFSGVRPKIHREGEPLADFAIQGESTHGIHGLVQLFGIESPGLTSSMAIAEIVAQELALPTAKG